MSQSYNNPEVRDAAIAALQALFDVVGYHFPWCPDYLSIETGQCICGLGKMRLAKNRLEREGQEEFNLLMDALESEE